MNASVEFIERIIPIKCGRLIDGQKESKEAIVQRLSHLYLNGKRIAEIGDLSLCGDHLKVLYLQHNRLRSIGDNLSALRSLTHLYLQRNRIEKIQGLEGLQRLQKLYLGMNRIRRLENLGGLRSLVELHVERQIWPDRIGDEKVDASRAEPLQENAFGVDALCVQELASHLKVLNITGLRLDSLQPFQPLQRLDELFASENAFECAPRLSAELAAFGSLRRVHLAGCPAQRDRHFGRSVLERMERIEMLDGKPVASIQRRFVHELRVVREKREAAKAAKAASKASMSGEIEVDGGRFRSNGGGSSTLMMMLSADSALMRTRQSVDVMGILLDGANV